MIRLAIILLIGIFSSFGYSQVKWTALEDLEDSLASDPKPVYIWIHTSWCGYCKMMEKNTFSDSKVGEKLNQNYYAVSIQADKPDTLVYAGTKYPSKIQPNGTYLNSLAEFLGEVNGKIAFPTSVFLTQDLVIEKQYQTYLRKSDFKYILKTLTK